ncbi:putative phage abortive infection protein [Achromobacter ruhlandii]|uniref:putative phage abortive infection protein n=1 Tax=Achromobacter ruhlandii TaxID=72557 RepID=UPI0009EEDC61|nr:putative phage abortive infection protein [Achromobacter ruhlandii]
MTQQTHEPPEAPSASKLVWVPVIVGLLLLSAYFAYFGIYRSAPPGQPESWGQFGDFLGGLLNPVVGTITIVLLVRTLLAQEQAIRLQTTELALARRDFELQLEETRASTRALSDQHDAIVRQSFEQTFFAWLQSYRQMIMGLQDASERSGILVLHRLTLSLKGDRATMIEDPSGQRVGDSPGPRTYDDAASSYLNGADTLVVDRFNRARASYHAIYERNHSILGPILRTLYRLMDWVDKSPLSAREKWHYCAITRSQLSWPEMMILLYSGCAEQGKNFVPLIEKYALFDNLESRTDGLVSAMRQTLTLKPCPDFPYTKRAFNSGVAKLELGIIEAKDL